MLMYIGSVFKPERKVIALEIIAIDSRRTPSDIFDIAGAIYLVVRLKGITDFWRNTVESYMYLKKLFKAHLVQCT